MGVRVPAWRGMRGESGQRGRGAGVHTLAGAGGTGASRSARARGARLFRFQNSELFFS